mmetsp:Transcript_25475/g.42508  ORF Transcript_25475/g.42508 Transcript_25475/m.42508 type:complete len:222 (+) Transcript_25475:76-741(+)
MERIFYLCTTATVSIFVLAVLSPYLSMGVFTSSSPMRKSTISAITLQIPSSSISRCRFLTTQYTFCFRSSSLTPRLWHKSNMHSKSIFITSRSHSAFLSGSSACIHIRGLIPFFSISVNGVATISGIIRWSSILQSTTIHQWISLSNRHVRMHPIAPRLRTRFFDRTCGNSLIIYSVDCRSIKARPVSIWQRLHIILDIFCHGSIVLQSWISVPSNSSCGL